MQKPISIKMIDCNRVMPVRLNVTVKFHPFSMKLPCAEKKIKEEFKKHADILLIWRPELLQYI